MISPDTPFRLVGGETEHSALINRINAIERIKFLSGVDLRDKSKEYRFTVDMEMYQRWYKDYPKDHKIDEEWCQRCAEVIKSMERNKVDYEKVDIHGRIEQVYKDHEALPLKEPQQKKKSFWQWVKEYIC